MAESEPIIQKIHLEGDEDVLEKLHDIGEKGFEAFEQLEAAAHKGASSFEVMGTGLALLVTAFVGATAAIGGFISAQAEAIQKTAFVGDAFGATAEQIIGIETAFAAAGVSANAFETFAQRLTTTIAREWPQIAEAVRTSATAQEGAQERVKAAMLRVEDAQRNLLFVNEQTAGKIAAANLRVSQTFTALRFAAEEAYSAQRRASESATSADLSLLAAKQRLATLEGTPPSPFEKQQLEIAQARAAVDQAASAAADASLAKRRLAAEAAAKQAAAEQAAADAQLKRDLTIQESINARAKAELQAQEAITARETAQEHASQQALKDIPNIAKAIDGITSGNKEAATAIDLTQVKVQDLAKGIFLAASAGGTKPPTGLQAMDEITKVLSRDTEGLIDHQTRLALIQSVGQRAISQTGASAFELLSALEKGPEHFKAYSDAAAKAFSTQEKGRANIEEFRKSLELLSQRIELINRDFAASAAPLFTKALDAIRSSIESSDGILHLFIAGIEALGRGIGKLIEYGEQLTQSIDKWFDLKPGTAMKVLIGAIVVAVGLFATAWLAVPAIIAVVVVAVGYLADNWDKVKAGAEAAWKAVQDTGVYKFLDGVITRLKEAWSWFSKLGWGKGDGKANEANPGPSQGQPATGDLQGLAGGGEVDGPGTGTSDSVFARLSRGEFVVRAAAVQTYGAELFHNLNRMNHPGFAAGGMLSSPSRVGSPSGGPERAGSTLNLTLDGKSFGPFRGSSAVVDELSSYAVGRQTSSAGRQPSWMK